MSLALDVGHAHTCSTMGEFLECDISHIHLHDNFGQSDDHLPLGKGNIDFEPVLKVIEEKGITGVLEQKTEAGAIESLERLRKLKMPDTRCL